MKCWSWVPCHGSPTPSSFSKSLWLSLSSPAPFPVRGLITFSTPAFVLASCALACFFIFVSSRMTVTESVGREMVLMALAFRVFATFFKRRYSAWCKCFVNCWATAWNSSSTMMYMSSALRPGRMGSSVRGSGGGDVEGGRSGKVNYNLGTCKTGECLPALRAACLFFSLAARRGPSFSDSEFESRSSMRCRLAGFA